MHLIQGKECSVLELPLQEGRVDSRRIFQQGGTRPPTHFATSAGEERPGDRQFAKIILFDQIPPPPVPPLAPGQHLWIKLAVPKSKFMGNRDLGERSLVCLLRLVYSF